MDRKNTAGIHEIESNEEKPEGKDNFILNVATIIVLLFIFAVPALIIAGGSNWALAFFAWAFLIILAFYVIIKLENKHRDAGPRKFKVPDNKLTCINGHTVTVYVNYDGGITDGGFRNNDVTCGASVWPQECPICGSPWHIPHKK